MLLTARLYTHSQIDPPRSSLPEFVHFYDKYYGEYHAYQHYKHGSVLYSNKLVQVGYQFLP